MDALAGRFFITSDTWEAPNKSYLDKYDVIIFSMSQATNAVNRKNCKNQK